MPEWRRLLARTLWRMLPSLAFVFAWSRWRRRKQLMAKRAHYRRRGFVFL